MFFRVNSAYVIRLELSKMPIYRQTGNITRKLDKKKYTQFTKKKKRSEKGKWILNQ